MNEYDDDNLLARLRAAGPARPTPADRAGRRPLEDVMGETSTRTTRRATPAPRPQSAPWLVAAAAVVLIVATEVRASSTAIDTAPTADLTVTSLTLPASQGRCQIPNAEVLRAQTITRGTRALADDTTTFRVDDWFIGGPTDLAR